MAEKLLFRVHRKGEKTYLLPSNEQTEAEAERRAYKNGDILACVLTKPRSPGFHRYAHYLGKLVVNNIESFGHMSEHSALKRLQIEGCIECDMFHVTDESGQTKEYLYPKSLSYESMDQVKFRNAVGAMMDFIVERYWPGENQDTINKMIDQMIAGRH